MCTTSLLKRSQGRLPCGLTCGYFIKALSSAGVGNVRNTVVSGNGLDGILVKDGAGLRAENVNTSQNGGHGLYLSSGSGSLRKCLSSSNGKGSILIGDDFDIDTAQLDADISSQSAGT